MMAELGKKIALGFGVTTAFFVLVELILLAAGVVPLYGRTDPDVGFSGYAPLFLKRTPSGGKPIAEHENDYLLQIIIHMKLLKT